MNKMLTVLSAVGLLVSFHSLSSNHVNPAQMKEGPLSKSDMLATRGAGPTTPTTPPNERICTGAGCNSPNIYCLANDYNGSDTWVYYGHFMCEGGGSSDSCNNFATLKCSTHTQYSLPGCGGTASSYNTPMSFCGM